MARPLLIGGGRRDASLLRLIAAAAQRDVAVIPVLIDEATEPAFGWDFASGELVIDGIFVDPAGLFLRYDVFTPRAAGAQVDRALGWYNAVLGWAAARPAVRLFNRDLSPQAGVKPYQLALAREHGLAVPDTWIGNDLARLRALPDGDGRIAKPVGGGAYVQPLDQALAGHPAAGTAPVPALVQERLAYPEYRVFVVGGDTHVFEVASDQLDYRPDPAVRLGYRGADGGISRAVEGCRLVAAALRCDFAACDLKTGRDGEPVFLELNTGPMFAAFDVAADGALAASILAALTTGPASPLDVTTARA